MNETVKVQSVCGLSVWTARTEDPGKAKVAEFDDLMLGDENIFRLHVSVDTLKHTFLNQSESLLKQWLSTPVCGDLF